MHTIKRGAKCHDIMDRVGNYWNQNLKLCLKNNGYTQETFAKAYKKQYGTGNQADVYRWLNVEICPDQAERESAYLRMIR